MFNLTCYTEIFVDKTINAVLHCNRWCIDSVGYLNKDLYENIDLILETLVLHTADFDINNSPQLNVV